MCSVSLRFRATPFVLLALVLVGCGGAVESDFASAADASGGSDATLGASGGTGTSIGVSGGTGTTHDSIIIEPASGGASSEAPAERPIPTFEGCSDVTLPCEPVSGTDVVEDWLYTFASLAYRCGASCLQVELATVGNCVTQVNLTYEPYARESSFTRVDIENCVQQIVGQRWECLPRDRWSEFSWHACVLM